MALTLRKKGINRLFWYQMFYSPKEDMGLLYENGTEKQSFFAYKTLTGLLRNAQWRGTVAVRPRDRAERVFALRYRTPNGTVIAVWRNTTLPFFGDSKPVQVRVSRKLVAVRDMYGHKIPVTREGKWVRVKCSWRPIYLVTR